MAAVVLVGVTRG